MDVNVNTSYLMRTPRRQKLLQIIVEITRRCDQSQRTPTAKRKLLQALSWPRVFHQEKITFEEQLELEIEADATNATSGADRKHGH